MSFPDWPISGLRESKLLSSLNSHEQLSLQAHHTSDKGRHLPYRMGKTKMRRGED